MTAAVIPWGTTVVIFDDGSSAILPPGDPIPEREGKAVRTVFRGPMEFVVDGRVVARTEGPPIDRNVGGLG